MEEFQPMTDINLEEKLSDKRAKSNNGSSVGFLSLFLKFIIIFFVILVSILVADYFYYKERAYPGIMIENYNVGGMTVSEIRQSLDREFSLISGQKQIHFYRNDESNGSLMALSFSDIGIVPLWEHVIRDVMMLGRRNIFNNLIIGDPVERLNIYTGATDNYNFPVKLTFDDEITTKVFEKIDELIYKEPKNAAVALKNDGSLLIREDVPGLELDRDKTKEVIIYETRNLAWARNSGMLFRVEIETRPVDAAIKVSDVEKFRFDNIKSTFSTSLGTSDENRRHNIKLASEKVHNTFLMPDSVFSFNEIVGRADAAAGYLESQVIVDGDFTPGIGGGICQVSTTLYNAAVKAGMEIIERHLHSRPVSYVDEGEDATISYPGKDFKFKNTLSNPVIIGVVIRDNRITVSIHGK